MTSKVKLGFIPANRRYFSTEMAAKARRETLAVLASLEIDAVVPDETMTDVGCVKNRDEGHRCGGLFRREGVDGILVGAVNFGDEQGIATAVQSCGANVPVLIYGCQEEEALHAGMKRRDAFCGLLSIAEAMRQIGVRYTVAQTPICLPTDEQFHTEVDHFARVCRVLKGLRGCRIGQIGPRPEAFWTCRCDEKMLQQIGVTVVPKDLSEVLGAISRLSDDDAEVRNKLDSIRSCADTAAVADEILLRIAKFERALDDLIKQAELDAVAVQCWNSLQLNYGIVACGVMARMGDRGIPHACESDVLGALSMYALQLAADSPAALLDWNNLHNDDPELVNLWHCGVYPPSFGKSRPTMAAQGIMSRHIGTDKSTGVLELVVREGPATVCRITQGMPGEGWKVFLGQGRFEDNSANTFGAYGWCRLHGLPHMYRDILLRHFPHHVAVTRAHVGNVLHEVFGNYYGMGMYHGGQAVPGLCTPSLPFAFVRPTPDVTLCEVLR
ncbi:MAG: fucose isomerase [Phycisphaerae bacterium]|nr:fucose isomerase [Phycisphaerae bacterium]